ncbi:MAG: SRPBCC family protein [Dermatophilaceae bacterium]
MITVLRGSVLIRRPADEVYAYVADLRNYPEWFPGVLCMDLVGDPADRTAVGTRYREVARLPGGREENLTVTVVVSDPGRALAIEVDLEPLLPRFEYEVTAVDDDTTRYTWTCRARNTTRRAWPTVLATRLFLGRRLRRALPTLKALLERPPEHHAGAWQVRRFGRPADVLRWHPRLPVPEPGRKEVVVEVAAASLNRLDARRCEGYGRTVLRMRGAATTPLTLGLDVAGVVCAVGREVRALEVGDRVFGVKEASSSGSHATAVVVPAANLVHTPAEVSDLEAAALPYPFLTAWSALSREARLGPATARGAEVLVHGAGTSVGLAAIQLARAWGARVTAVCGANSRDAARSAGADLVLDRHDLWHRSVSSPIDVALCCADPSVEPDLLALLRPDAGATLVSIVHPTLDLTDQRGIVGGLLAATRLRRAQARTAARSGSRYRWCLMRVEPAGMSELSELVYRGALHAFRVQELPFTDLATAVDDLARGRITGKVVMSRNLQNPGAPPPGAPAEHHDTRR